MDGLRNLKTALLLSGGMDSVALAYWKRPDVAITLDYGQLAAAAEVGAAGAVTRELGIIHHVIQVDLRPLGSGDMAGSPVAPEGPASDWWPFRNQMLITLAAMKAIAAGCQRLLIGTVATDQQHRDGTPEFVESLDRLLSLQEGGLRLEAPAIGMTTTDLVRTTQVPMSLLSWAHSCHKANVVCGQCRGCNKYFDVWRQLGYGLG